MSNEASSRKEVIKYCENELKKLEEKGCKNWNNYEFESYLTINRFLLDVKRNENE